MIWEDSYFVFKLYFFIIFGIIILLSMTSSEKINGRTKNILVALMIGLSLSIFIVPKWRINKYVEDGYTVIVNRTGTIGEALGIETYVEIHPEEYLYRPYIYYWKINHENKIVILYFEKFSSAVPRSLNEIKFDE